jgi:Cellulase (glycosyl hydrolase family 5)
MLRAHRLPAVRLCLLFLGAVLSSAAVLVLAASVDPSRAAAASLPGVGVSAPAAGPVSKGRAKGRKSSAVRRGRCAAAARAGEHRKAHKACAVKKAKAKGIEPSVSPKPADTASPSVASPSTPAPAIGGDPPAEALEVPGSPPVEEPKPSVEEKVKEVKTKEEVKAKEEQKLKEEKAREESPTSPVESPLGPEPLSIAVSGNNLVNGGGKVVTLHGVNLNGTQWSCLWGRAFESPTDEASIDAMVAWHINAVRIPLNEDCWLGINGAPTDIAAYHEEIKDYVDELGAHGIYVILDLHWSAPGTTLSHLGAGFNGFYEMADESHAPAFWESLASYFKSDHAVLFDLFNEPFGISWSCWLNGCVAPRGYQTAGMQQLVDVVRNTGATQPVMVGGLEKASELGQEWLDNRPTDPANQLVASVHVYSQTNIALFNKNIGVVAAQFPVVTGETGDVSCVENDFNALLPWADEHGVSYLAWAWNTGECANYMPLISNYNGTPTTYGIGYREHLLARFPPPEP